MYRADPTRDSQHELSSTPLDGSTPSVRLNDPLALGSNVGGSVINEFNTGETDYLVAAGSGRVVYVADSINDEFDDLFSIPGDRSTGPVQLSAGIPFGDVQDFWLSEDGQVVVFLAGEFGQSALFRVPTDGSAPATPFTDYTHKLEVWLSHDGATVVYSEVTNFGTRMSLYQVPVDGSAAPSFLVQSAPPILLGSVMLTGLGFSDDDMRIVFEQVFDEDELVRSDAGDVADFVVTAGSTHVVYRADQTVDQRFELFRVPIGGGTPVLLTPVAAGVGVQGGYVASSDGQTLYYLATHSAATVVELFRVAADGSSAPVRLSGALVTGGNVSAFALTPDQQHLAYLADQRTDGVFELFGATPVPGTDILLHALPATGDVSSFRIAPDSASVVYRADALDSVFELFAVPPDGSAPRAGSARRRPTTATSRPTSWPSPAAARSTAPTTRKTTWSSSGARCTDRAWGPASCAERGRRALHPPSTAPGR